jgi:hypothetical protein
LRKHSIAFKTALVRTGFDPTNVDSEKAVLARVRLPKIDQDVLNYILGYFAGEIFVTDASLFGTDDIGQDELHPRLLSILVQCSSFAHTFRVGCLQKVAMHGLWYYLVTMRQKVSTATLQEMVNLTFEGCPARLLLEGFLHNQVDEGFDVASVQQMLIDAENTSVIYESLANRVIEIATTSTGRWTDMPLTDPMIYGVCENRSSGLQWKEKSCMVSLEAQLGINIPLHRKSEVDQDQDPSPRRPVWMNGDLSDWDSHAWKRTARCGDTIVFSSSGLGAWVDNPMHTPQDKLTTRYHNTLAKVEKAFQEQDPGVREAVESALMKNPQYKEEAVALWHVALELVYHWNEGKGYRLSRRPVIIPPATRQ